MDREGAETYLRLLAEAAMRGSLAPAAAARAPNASTIMVVGHALTAVGALDPATAEEILADFRLAVTVRQLHGEPGQAVTAAQWLAQGRPVLRGKPRPAPSPGEGASGEGAPGEGAPGDGAGQYGADQDRADRGRADGPGRPVRPGRADDPVPRGCRQRRTVPHVVRADRHGCPVYRGVAGTFPGAGGPAEPSLPRPDPVRRVHGHRRPGRPIQARPHARQRPGLAEHDQAEPRTAGEHPLARRRPAVPAERPRRPEPWRPAFTGR